jgi:hypothetical protein
VVSGFRSSVWCVGGEGEVGRAGSFFVVEGDLMASGWVRRRGGYGVVGRGGRTEDP